MSHPNPSHDRENEYPEDAVTSFGKGKQIHKSKGFDKAAAKHKALKKRTGFDSKKRWGNSATKGHGVNSPAMMEARKKFLQ